MQYAGPTERRYCKIQNEIKPQIDKMMLDGSAPRIPTFDNVEDNLDLKLFESLNGHAESKSKSSFLINPKLSEEFVVNTPTILKRVSRLYTRSIFYMSYPPFEQDAMGDTFLPRCVNRINMLYFKSI